MGYRIDLDELTSDIAYVQARDTLEAIQTGATVTQAVALIAVAERLEVLNAWLELLCKAQYQQK